MWQAIRIATQLSGTVVLARLVSPSSFGLLAMVTSVIGIGEILRDFGLTSAAVQARSLSRQQKSNLFWLNTAIGALLTVLVFAVAPAIAALYGDSRLLTLAHVLSVTFVLNGVQTQFRAELIRNMRFGPLNVTDTIPSVLGLLAAAVAASQGLEEWALVFQPISSALFGLVLAVVLARWMPGMPSRKAQMRSLLGFAGGQLGTQGVSYVTRNADNVMIGLAWGSGPLGLYTRAFQLLMAPIVQLLAPMTRVALPVLSRLQDDRTRFVAFLRRGQLVGSLVAGALYAFCIGMADPLVLIIFGEGWTGLVPIFQALAIGGVFRALNQVVFWAYLALGLSMEQFRFYLISQPFIVLAMLAGLPWGPLGVAVGHSLAYALNWVAALWWCGRKTGIPVRPFLVDGVRSLLWLSAPVVAIGTLTAQLVENSWLALLVGLLGSGAWLGIACVLSRRLRHDVHALLDLVQRARGK